jgi:exopolysaccharide biosynthesis protein
MSPKRSKLSVFFMVCLLCYSFLPTVNALEAAPVCVDTPYDYTYRDERLFVAIKRYEEQNLVYFVADVQVQDAAVLQAALSGDKPYGREEPVSAIAQRNQAILAINADDYGTHKYGVIIRNGSLIRATKTTRNMLIVEENGDMSVHADRGSDQPGSMADTLLSRRVWQTFEFGPELVRNGEAVAFNKAFDVISTRDDRLEPRTAIGQIGPLHYILIVVDGRQDGYSQGMTLQQLQQLFVRFGANTAMNLDGGGSTELWFQGQILNQPSGGKERAVTDIIMFK